MNIGRRDFPLGLLVVAGLAGPAGRAQLSERDESMPVTSFAPGQHIEGKLFDLIIIADKTLKEPEWSIAVTSHDAEATDFIADVFYRTRIPGIDQDLTLHVTLNGPAWHEQACMADRNTEIPLANVRQLRVRLFKKLSETKVKLGTEPRSAHGRT